MEIAWRYSGTERLGTGLLVIWASNVCFLFLEQLTYARCFPWSGGTENSEFTLKTFNDSILSWRSICYSAAFSAKSSYQRALHLAPWQANLYTDIAISSDLVSSLSDDSETSNSW